jgi:hypothetical protein
VERLIFGGGDGPEIDAVVGRFAEVRLGSPVKAVLFRRTSVGVVTGAELLDGRRVVIKAHQPQQRKRQAHQRASLGKQVGDVGLPADFRIGGEDDHCRPRFGPRSLQGNLNASRADGC